ncbi:hypothetical protein [Uliginosibacterium gangwonense]|uniref:hypothetical protein n=1 Tax=Uliginosibacterium gangwonense TaxID=392736 RepID=UPI00047599EC|nr:hypothetical protein [Uliginosibacterium gangwonense]
MNRRLLSVALIAATLLPSCASMDSKTEGAAIGGGIGCAGGAIIAAVTKNNVGAGCAAGAIVGGLIGYMKARDTELADAQKATETAAKIEGAKVSPVETDVVRVTDKASNKKELVETFKSVSVDIPVRQVDTPDGKAAIAKLEEYARKTAAQRQEIVDMTFASRPEKSTGAAKVTLKQTLETAGKGKVRRTYVADPRMPGNVQRIKIEVKNKDDIEV